MNREIKFRAWDKQNKTMGTVNRIKMSPYLHTQVTYSMEIDGKRKDEWSLIDDTGHGTCVLMQFTGLKDKNGKEIYEGDICNCREYGCFGIIKWSEDEAGFYFYVVYGDGTFDEESVYDYADELEVIGNIYENPELLEG